jgi:RimJ/RimL family protein N-acetyltransferase
MSDAALREATASDELTLGEELANQRSWLDDEAKLTFIVCATAAAGGGAGSRAALPADATSGMCGDANLFFLKPEHTAEYAAAAGAAAGAVAEVMVMVADAGLRRRGLAGEAVCALLRYGMERRGVAAAVAKISAGNAPSLALFAKLGFVVAKRVPAFDEVHLVAGPAQRLRERVYDVTARAGYAEAADVADADAEAAAAAEVVAAAR